MKRISTHVASCLQARPVTNRPRNPAGLLTPITALDFSGDTVNTSGKFQPVLCDACAKLGTSDGPCTPHNDLLHRGSIPDKLTGTWEDVYRCSRCNTIWVRPVSKWGIAGSFRLSAMTARNASDATEKT